MCTIRSKNINDFLFYILLFFGLFDAARNYTPLPEWFGYSKDIAIFFLYVLNYKRVKFLPQKLIVIQCFFWFIWGFMGIVYSGGYPAIKIVIGILKYLEFFMLITLFYNWNELFNMRIEQALDKYILGSMCVFLVNIIGYFIPNPICYVGLSNGNVAAGLYGGRISVGQPPIAALPMLFSCVYLIFCRGESIIKIFYLSIGIILSTSNTGIITLSVCIAMYFGYCIFTKKKISRKHIIFIICLMGMIIIFHKQLYLIFEDQIVVYKHKIIEILKGGVDASMEGRKENWRFAISTLHKPGQWIFGRGMYGFCIEGEYHYIENTYISLLCTYGILGLSMFLSYLLKIGIRYVKCFFKNRHSIYIFGLSIIIIYLLHMYTLDNLISYTMTFAFSFFYTVVEMRSESIMK